MSNVIQFRHPEGRRPIARPIPTRLGYPTRMTVCTDEDEQVSIDPRTMMIESVAPEYLPDAGDPTLSLEQNGVISFDLGDCTPHRTILRLSPETARVWARALAEKADQADER